jgi:tetratricopeptide (TPR) repeat protein
MRQLVVPSLAVVALLVVSLAAWWLWPRKATIVTPPAGKPTLAVLFFENISGDPSLNTWRTGLPELLTTGLLESRAINVVSTDRVFGILKKLNLAETTRYSDDDLTGVAREGSIQYLVTGSVMKAGQSTVITARLQRADTHELIDSRKIECATEQEILSKADGLTAQIRAALGPSAGASAGESTEPLVQVMTSSPLALRYYTEARRFHLNNEYSDAIRLYEQAIEADPGFAMAYRGMASCYSNNGDIAKAEAAADKALSLGDRLPERLKYQVQITACAERGNYPGEVDASNKLLAKYPDDNIGLNKLGTISEEGEEFDKAVGYFTMAAQSSPTLLSAENLAGAYRFLGQYDRSAAVLSTYIERDPDNARAHVSLGLSHAAAGRLDDAQREADKASLLAPSDAWVLQLRGCIAYLRGDWPAAEREFTAMLGRGSEADQPAARAGLAGLYAAQGRFDKARECAKQTPPHWGRAAALELDSGHPERAAGAFHAALAQPTTAYRPFAEVILFTGFGLSRAAAGDVGGAQTAAADLEAKSRPFFVKPATRWKLAISGTLAAKRGDGGAATRDLERAVASLPFQSLPDEEHALMLDLLAQAYVVAGDLAKAQQTYERITGLTTGRTMWGGIYARSFYRLGQIAERQGDPARARANFTTFLDLWKNADPGLPEVADARKRLGR